MPEAQPPESDADDRPSEEAADAGRGRLIVATIVLCGGVGLGLGAVVGAPVPLAVAGVFIGALIGNVVVARRFSDL
jgi:hypothetical protein